MALIPTANSSNPTPPVPTVDRIVRIGIFAAIAWGILWLLSTLADVLIPFAVALLLAYVIHPLVHLLQKRLKNRGLSVVVALLVVIILISGLSSFVVPMITREITNVGRTVKALVQNTELSRQAAARLPQDYWQALTDFFQRPEVQKFLNTDSFWSLAQDAGKKVLPGVWGVISGTWSFLLGLLGLSVIALYLFFLLLDWDRFMTESRELLPAEIREPVLRFIADADRYMNQYFRAQALVAFLVGVMFAIGFLLIGMPLAILLGLFIGFLNMIPYLQVAGLVPAAILATVKALETHGSIGGMLLATLAVFAIVQLIQDFVLTPKIMGGVMGLNPVAILLSLSVWGKLLGFFGLLIAIPVTCLLSAYWRLFLQQLGHKPAAVPLVIPGDS